MITLLLPSDALRLENRADFLQGVSSRFDKEVPNGNELRRAVIVGLPKISLDDISYLEVRVNDVRNVVLPPNIL